jgi:hypothetical protein
VVCADSPEQCLLMFKCVKGEDAGRSYAPRWAWGNLPISRGDGQITPSLGAPPRPAATS